MTSLRFLFLLISICLMTLPGAATAPAQTLVFGDSLSAQYGIQTVFSGSSSGPRARNWTEFLVTEGRLSFGNERNVILLGLFGIWEFNWSVPGAVTDDFRSTYIPIFGGDIEDDLGEVDRVVIFLGGNDVNGIYQDLYDDTVSQNEIDDLVGDMEWITDWVRDRDGSIPIYVCTIIDVGVTPDVRDDPQHTDPAKRAVATQNIAEINAQIAAFAPDYDAHIVDMFAVSRRLAEQGPPEFAGVQILPGSDSDNDQRYLFCKDDFHPNTSGQILIGNAILEAITAHEPGVSLPPVSEREALEILELEGLMPAAYTAYYNYVDTTTSGLFNDNFTANSDGDALTNGEEFVFGTPLESPQGQVLFTEPDSGPARTWTYSLNTSALGTFTIQPRTATDFSGWTDVPAADISQGLSSGGLTPFTVTLPGDDIYLRIEIRE